jgi:hypothetical protein
MGYLKHLQVQKFSYCNGLLVLEIKAKKFYKFDNKMYKMQIICIEYSKNIATLGACTAVSVRYY